MAVFLTILSYNFIIFDYFIEKLKNDLSVNPYPNPV